MSTPCQTLLAALFLASAVSAQCELALPPGAPVESGPWDDAVVVSNNTLAMTVHADGVDRVRVFTGGAGKAWQLQAELTAGGMAEGFGTRLALEADLWGVAVDATLAVSAPNAGAVYVFERSGTTWTLAATFIGPPADGFGGSLAFSGVHLLVGARLDDDAGADAGAVYPFLRHWTLGWMQWGGKVIGSDVKAGDHFGSSLAMDGGLAAIVAPGADEAGLDSGVSYVFGLSETSSLIQYAKLVPSYFQPLGSPYETIDIDSGLVVMGNPGAFGGFGAATAFQWLGASGWAEQPLFPAQPYAGYQFGRSVAVAYPQFLVGDSAGTLHVFEQLGGLSAAEVDKVEGVSSGFGLSLSADYYPSNGVRFATRDVDGVHLYSFSASDCPGPKPVVRMDRASGAVKHY